MCRRLFPRIRAYGLRHLGDLAAASDLAQEVLLVVLEALRAGSVREPERLAAFVMGTARQTLWGWRRGERRRDALLERFAATFDDEVAMEPSGIDHARLEHCLNGLTPRARTVVAMTYFGEQEGKVIAEALAMTLGSVRVTRHRALQQLLSCIEGAP